MQVGGSTVDAAFAVFSNNIAGRKGGGCLVDSSTISLDYTLWNFNRQALVVEDTDISIFGATFEDNVAGQGAAIVSSGGSILLDSCQFLRNSASSRGGALCLGPEVTAYISNTTFQHNSAITGGAISVKGNVKRQICTLTIGRQHRKWHIGRHFKLCVHFSVGVSIQSGFTRW